MDMILKESILVNDDHDKQGPTGCGTVFLDTTVQEKNITFPTDAKLANKIIEQYRKSWKNTAFRRDSPTREP